MKVKTVRPGGKGMAIVCWDAGRIIYVKYIANGQTIIGDYYLCLIIGSSNQRKLSPFEKDPLSSRQCKGAHMCSFNAKNHEVEVPIGASFTIFTRYGSKCLFFFKLEKIAWWTTSNETFSFGYVITQTEEYFADFPSLYFLGGIRLFELEKRLYKCVELKRDYVEK